MVKQCSGRLRLWLGVGIGIAVPVACVLAVPRLADLEQLRAQLDKLTLEPLWLVPFVLLYVANLYVRGLLLARVVWSPSPSRANKALGGAPNDSFALASLQNMAASVSNILLSDLVIGWLVGRRDHASAASPGMRALGLLQLRVWEVVWIAACGVPAVLLLMFPDWVGWTLAGILGAGLSALIIIELARPLLRNVSNRAESSVPHASPGAFHPLIIGLSGVKILTAAGYTICALASLGCELDIVQGLFFVSVFALALAVPLQGLAGFGNYEIGSTVALVLLGVDNERALLLAIVLHLQLLSASILAGVIGLSLIGSLMGRNEKTRTQ